LGAGGDGLDGALVLGGGGCHLVEVRGAGESLAVDGGDLRGNGTVDGDEDDAAGDGSVAAGVDHDVGDVAGCGLQGSVAEIGIGVIEIAEGAIPGEDVGRCVVERPEIGGEKILRAEDAEIVGLGDGSGDVVETAVFVFGDGDLHAWIFSINLRLETTQEVDGSIAELLVNPRIAVVVVVKGGIP